MIKEDIRTLASLADSMHKLAEGLETMAAFLIREAGDTDVLEPEPVAPQITLEEIRAVLAEKSATGHTDKVRQLLLDFGAEKLSAVDPKDYAALKAKAEVL